MELFSGIVTFLVVSEALVEWLGTREKDPVHDPPIVEFNDENCKLVGEQTVIGSEDLALGKAGVLFITSGDLKMTFAKGSSSANPGGIFALNMLGSSESPPVELSLAKFPPGVRFQPHGIYVSNSSDHLLTTSHAGDHSRVELFRIEYHPECLEAQPWSCPPATLHHLNSITSDLFPNYGVNDVVEGTSPQELYVTQWLTVPYPEHGLASGSYVETKLAPKLLSFLWKFGFTWTRVFRCTWEEGVEGGLCEPVTGRSFYGANGITASHDRNQLFINDPYNRMITIMERQNDGSLEEVGHIDLPWVVDNIEMDGGEIIMGSIPDLGKYFQAIKDPIVGIPGGMLVARMVGGVWRVDQNHTLVHDGSKLSQISAAARWGNKVVLGSPMHRGCSGNLRISLLVRVCSMNEIAEASNFPSNYMVERKYLDQPDY